MVYGKICIDDYHTKKMLRSKTKKKRYRNMSPNKNGIL